MGRMVRDAKHLLDHESDPFGGPDLANEAEGRRALRQLLAQVLTLHGSQAWGRAGRGPTAQAGHAADSATRDPLAHGALRDAERRSDGLLFPALLMQFPGAEPPSF